MTRPEFSHNFLKSILDHMFLANLDESTVPRVHRTFVTIARGIGQKIVLQRMGLSDTFYLLMPGFHIVVTSR